MLLPSDVLDPGDASLAGRDAFDAWLIVQRGWALRPQEAVAQLRRDPDPRRLADRGHGLPTSRGDLSRDRAALRRCLGGLIPFPSQAYPEALSRLTDAAPVLAIRGEPEALTGPCVAIVGARAATVYGLEVARRLSAGLARAGVVVVSGLARGIDAAAHRGALEAGGRTVAVQACGLDQVYPAAHRRLADEIASHGALVSELPPGTPPRKAHFPLRNRLISGLSRAVVVVEARERSGSLVTARHALDQGIDVLAVPGPVTAPTSAGTNALLRDGAAPALEAGDVLRAAGLEPEPPTVPDPKDVPSGASLTTQAQAILAALLHGPATRDELGRSLALEPGVLAAALLSLELAGWIAEDRDGCLRAVQSR